MLQGVSRAAIVTWDNRPVTWPEFGTSSALERDVLERALPLVLAASTGESRAVIDLASDTAQVFMTIHDVLGATPGSCVQLLQIRPLLVGTAWKVLDLLIEAALDMAGESPRSQKGWRIEEKIAQAKTAIRPPLGFPLAAWDALLATYVRTEDLRHSLVHRKVYTDPSGALVGVDRRGQKIRPLTGDEQEALGRAVLRASQLVLATGPDERGEADLARQLGLLTDLHGVQLPTVSLPDALPALPELVVIVDRDVEVTGRYRLDVPALVARCPWPEVVYADLTIEFRDRPGQQLRGRLERTPHEVVLVDPDAPPIWLS